MIFYRTPDNVLHPTQADARAHDPNFEQTDIPTDKPGLLNHLNTLRAPVSTPGECKTCAARDEGEQQAVAEFQNATITIDFLQERIATATPAELALIINRVTERLYSFGKELA